MMALAIELPSESDTIGWGSRFANLITPPMLLGFSGDLGMGKTTFIRALIKQLGMQGIVKSPSYSLIETYELDTLTILHADFYRLSHPDAFIQLGFEDYLDNNTVCCIEWPELAGTYLPPTDITFTLSLLNLGRLLTCEAHTHKGEMLLATLSEAA